VVVGHCADLDPSTDDRGEQGHFADSDGYDGASKAISQTLIGATNTTDPGTQQEIEGMSVYCPHCIKLKRGRGFPQHFQAENEKHCVVVLPPEARAADLCKAQLFDQIPLTIPLTTGTRSKATERRARSISLDFWPASYGIWCLLG